VLTDVSQMDQRCDAVTMVMREGFSVTAITARLKLRVHHDDVITQLANENEGHNSAGKRFLVTLPD